MRDGHAVLESLHYSDINKQKVYLIKSRLDSAGMSVPDGSPQACRSLMGHVSLRCVSDYACRSLIKYVEIPDQACRSPMKHVELSVGSEI